MEKYYELKLDHVEAYRELGDLEKVIHKVHYRYYVTNSEGFEAHLHKTVNIGDVDENSFTPFEELTKAQVIEWITPFVDEEALKIEVDQKLQDAFYPENLILEINN